MSKYIDELGWKNDNPFFIELNKNLAELRQIILACNKDMRLLTEYYNHINTLKILYTIYIKEEDIAKRLSKIREFIYSKAYFDLISGKDKTQDTYLLSVKALSELNALSEMLMENLGLLLPKINQRKINDPREAFKN